MGIILKQIKYLTIIFFATDDKLCPEIYDKQDPDKKTFYTYILFMVLQTVFLSPDTSVYESFPSLLLVKCTIWKRYLCKVLSLTLSLQDSFISTL